MSAFLLLVGAIAVGHTRELDDGGDVLRLVLDGYVGNRESIIMGSGEYVRRSYPFNGSLSDAVRYSSETAVEAKLSIAFDGEFCRIDEIYDEGVTKSSKRPLETGKFESGYPSSRLLTDGTNTLDASVPVWKNQVQQAQLRRGTILWSRFHESMPLGVGLPRQVGIEAALDFETGLKAALNLSPGTSTTVAEAKSNDSSATVEIEIKKGGKVWRRHVVDIERGGIPIRSEEYHDGNLRMIKVNDDVRLVGAATWMPFHVRIVFDTSRDSGKASYVHDVRVISFSGSKPEPSELRIRLPRGSTFADEISGQGFVVAEESAFGFGEYALPIATGTVAPFRNPANYHLDTPERRMRRWPPWAIVVVSVCALVFLVSLAVKIKRFLTT